MTHSRSHRSSAASSSNAAKLGGWGVVCGHASCWLGETGLEDSFAGRGVGGPGHEGVPACRAGSSSKCTAEFNWTNNKDAFQLANEYRRVADQAILVFDISVARETQPLNTPKLMDKFELQLKRNGLSDPRQLIPLLEDISTDEHLPLIARNHALRLIKKIEK